MQGKYNSLLIAIALVAGIIAGFAGGTVAFRYRLLHVPGEGPLQRMDRVLKLTPAQREEIGGVIAETRDKMRDLRRGFRQQRFQLMANAHGKIRNLLNPDQQKDFDRYFVPARFHDRWEHDDDRPGVGGMELPARPSQAPN